MEKGYCGSYTDGTAVLGLGDIGPLASLPVMEGKCCLFKRFAGLNAVPLVIDEHDTDKLVEIIKAIGLTYGGINLEDISSPRCVEIENRLKAELDIPVFHDDQHGTAIVVLAGLINALMLVDKDPGQIKLVVNGTGAAGSAVIKMLRKYGIEKIYAFNSKGILNADKAGSYNPIEKEIAQVTNKERLDISLGQALEGADVFVGVSVGGILSGDMVRSMAPDPIIFALANPDPEIAYEDARAAGAKVVATGRSDYPNQVNNVLAFPGIFKGALESGARQITEGMKLAAAEAIASLVDRAHDEFIIPNPFDERVAQVVAEAVYKQAQEEGVVREGWTGVE